jgi:hypothetical protein
MTSGGMNTDIIAPKTIIVPTNATEDTTATTGELKMSGAMLYFFNGTAWEAAT